MQKIREIQVSLSNKGFDPGPIDGAFGPKTKDAIISALKTIPDVAWSRITEKPVWLKTGLKYLGECEIKGMAHNPHILNWWSKIRAPFTDDETPWCAAFVGGILEAEGIRSTRSAAARSYTKFGFELSGPAVGAVVVFWRGKPDGWAGHVGFVVGKDQDGNIMVLGGIKATRFP